jgi:HSP20 family protein
MALIRWEPARELGSLQTEMNRLFSTFFDGTGAPADAMRRWVPPMDLVEGDEHFVLRADLPGVRQEDVSVEFEGDVLTISGERRIEHDAKEGGFVRLERAAGAFRRTLTLPDGVDPEGVTAAFTDGGLEVRIPKPAERRPHRVAIAVGDQPAMVEA